VSGVSTWPAVLAAGLLLAGCSRLSTAGAPRYKPLGPLSSSGYADRQVAADTFDVTVQSNGLWSNERMQDYALLRAAELTRKNGFRYFVVLRSKEVIDMPDPIRNSPEQEITFRSASYWAMRVRCSADPTGEASEYEAAVVQESVKQKYGLQ
jgi:hypothetical protein